MFCRFRCKFETVQIIHYQTGSEKKVKNSAGSICNIFLKVALHAPSNEYK